ncbi:hypothetical protein AGLY_004003 [Aphis glycines]|uniref:Uncharacterized protein n=1 Tax=Aphis glycines TaxID=307491 RepID=A0A6G0TX85_APHGL|nr:hypothetical protein AGLY_004003 [Aphis glycines]
MIIYKFVEKTDVLDLILSVHLKTINLIRGSCDFVCKLIINCIVFVFTKLLNFYSIFLSIFLIFYITINYNPIVSISLTFKHLKCLLKKIYLQTISNLKTILFPTISVLYFELQLSTDFPINLNHHRNLFCHVFYIHDISDWIIRKKYCHRNYIENLHHVYSSEFQQYTSSNLWTQMTFEWFIFTMSNYVIIECIRMTTFFIANMAFIIFYPAMGPLLVGSHLL